jgi:hypothetical protein
MRGGCGRLLLSKRVVLRLISPSRGGNEQFEKLHIFLFQADRPPISGRPARVSASDEFGARNVTRTLSIDRSWSHCKERPS